MKLIPVVGMVMALAMGPTFAQTTTARAADSSKPASKAANLKLPSVSGDTFDLLKLKQPMVVLVAGTDSVSGAAAEAVQKAFAAATEPAMYFAVLVAGMAKTKAAADKWQLGYVALSDSGRKMMRWLSSNVPQKVLSPKAGVPFAVFIDAAGKVIKAETSVTEASVIEGVTALTKKEQTSKVTDPACGMTVDKRTAAATYEYEGKTYYFCSTACKDDFVKDPHKYLAQ